MNDPAVGHVIANFRIYAGLDKGEFKGSNWQDEWAYKWIEAASYVYASTGDEQLDRQMDELIALIAKAQEPDGYISCNILKYKQRLVVPRRHELYNMGHLITAACAHSHATGKSSFLHVAVKCADFLYRYFVPMREEHANFSVTKSYLMAVVDLYRVTRDRRYLELANVFIDLHGRKRTRPIEREPVFQEVSDFDNLRELNGTDLRQSRVPLREESYAVGHAVNSTYLYAGAADVAMEQDDPQLLAALERIWTNLTARKMYVHGGVCADQLGVSIRGDLVGEAHGRDYDLPNSTGYNETCAQIGAFMWNWRMLLITGEARFVDVMELCLYNSILASVSQSGDSWFYMNPLRWYGKDHAMTSGKHHHQRYQPLLGHTCCPTNLTRLIAGLHGYFYTVNDNSISVDHYGASCCDGFLPDGAPVRLRQETQYPWDGVVTIIVGQASERAMTIRARIPDWAEGAHVRINGEEQDGRLEPSSYFAATRQWKEGDTMELDFQMKPRLLAAHPKVEACVNSVAVKRGPIVYCLESPDLPNGVRVSQVRLPRGAVLTPKWEPVVLNGITVLEGKGLVTEPEDWDGPLYRRATAAPMTEVPIRLIPYYAWGNRGMSEMSVWIPLA